MLPTYLIHEGPEFRVGTLVVLGGAAPSLLGYRTTYSQKTRLPGVWNMG